jgi:hypothetical protein
MIVKVGPDGTRSEVEHRMASISATRPLRSRPSISSARQSSSGPAPGRRVSSQQAGPSGSTRPRWSRQRRPSVPFCRVHPIRSSSSRWAIMASTEPTRTSYAQSTFAIGWKVDRAMRTPFAASSWLTAGSSGFVIRLAHIAPRGRGHCARHRSLRFRREGQLRGWATGCP